MNREERMQKIIEAQAKLNAMTDDELRMLENMAEVRAGMQKDLASYLSAQKQIKDNDQLLASLMDEIRKKRAAGDTKEAAYLLQKAKILKQTNELMRQEFALIDRNYVLQKELANKLNDQGKAIAGKIKSYIGGIGEWLSFLNDADKSFRRMVFSMGKTADGSKILRNNLAEVASYAGNLGLTFQELTQIQAGFSEETGRQLALSQKSLIAVTEMAKGTYLGVEGATQMAAQFDRLNYSASAVRDFTEGVLNDSAKIGVNGNKTLKTLNASLEKAQRYNFKNGVDGLKNMAMYSEKFKINMDGVFNAIDKTRTLEGAVSSVAELNVLGGKFAKQDPFRLLFLARNDAEGFAKEIGSMTDGLIQFDKNGKALPILAGNFDRVNQAAQALNMNVDDLIKQAQQGNKFKLMDQFLSGMNKEDKALISSLAESDGKGGFNVTVDAKGTVKNIKDLSNHDILGLRDLPATLEKRAKENQAIDEQFKNALIELKSALLPVLQGLNSVITGLKPFINKWTVGALAIGVAVASFGKWIGIFTGGIGKLIGSGVTKMLGMGRAGGASATAGASGAGATGGSMGSGIMGAITGGLKSLVNPYVIGGIVILELAIWGLGKALQSWVPVIPVLAQGFKVLTESIGDFAVKVLGSVTDNLIKLGKSGIGMGILATAAGVTALGGALAIFATGGMMAGISNFFSGGLIEDIMTLASYGDDLILVSRALESVSKGFKSINNDIGSINMNNLKELKETTESLSRLSIRQGLFSSLSSVLGSVELKLPNNGKIETTIDVTMNMDSNRVAPIISKKVIQSINASRRGTTSNSNH